MHLELLIVVVSGKGSTRKFLGALVKEQSLDEEGLQTLLCEAESIINGRPLTTFFDDPKDVQPLTPSHYLLLRHDIPLPPGLFVKNDTYSRRCHDKFNTWLMFSGATGKGNIFLYCNRAKKRFRPKENLVLETP